MYYSLERHHKRGRAVVALDNLNPSVCVDRAPLYFVAEPGSDAAYRRTARLFQISTLDTLQVDRFAPIIMDMEEVARHTRCIPNAKSHALA